MTGSDEMHFGVSMFHTDYSIPAVQLARALEERGFESMWAPEHSHIPVPRRTPFPGGGEVPKPYYEVMDPFVVLSAAAAVTKALKLATGVCLVVQRDPIQTATRCLDRSGLGRALPLRRWRRLECRGNRGPWHGLQNPLQG
jgi:alkanesulfonate monooxygenase SsuD/methylene tetrahydromethanopterin reductase-like flavin-dependent oxidoreductase (luciferase family)